MSWAQTSSRSYYCKKDEFYNSLQSCAQIHSDASSIKNSRCKGGSGKIMGKLEKIPAWQLTKVRNNKKVIDEARTKEMARGMLSPRHVRNRQRRTC